MTIWTRQVHNVDFFWVDSAQCQIPAIRTGDPRQMCHASRKGTKNEAIKINYSHLEGLGFVLSFVFFLCQRDFNGCLQGAVEVCFPVPRLIYSIHKERMYPILNVDLPICLLCHARSCSITFHSFPKKQFLSIAKRIPGTCNNERFAIKNATRCSHGARRRPHQLTWYRMAQFVVKSNWDFDIIRQNSDKTKHE